MNTQMNIPVNIFHAEVENEINNYRVDSFKTLSIEEYQQLLNEKYRGFIVVNERPINVMAAVKHECRICGKEFYNRVANMLGGVVERQHHCLGKKSEETV
ncbi:hypothetical protein ICG_04190 [Bacillus cereus BAG1X1-3]|nr:hypothetical protein ICG_04190 [Bacillus cereus BAG1X1-3]